MSRFIRTSLSMAALGLASYQGIAGADDNFIKQPKLQQSSKVAPAQSQPTIALNSDRNLVTQPSSLKTPSVAGQTSAVQALAAQPPTVQTPAEQTPSTQTPPTPAQTNQSAQALSIQPQPTQNAAEQTNSPQGLSQNSFVPSTPPASTSVPMESARDPNGLVWVKRGSAENFRLQLPASPQTSTVTELTSRANQAYVVRQEIHSPRTANSDQAHTSALQGQATASAFSLAKASSANPVVIETAQSATSVTKPDSLQSEKMHLASRVSKQILGDRDLPKKQLALNGASLMGPAAMEQQLSSLMTKSEQLCRRGLYMSAREESTTAMIQLSRYLDSLSNQLRSEPCLRSAITAMKEPGDFGELMSLKSLQDLAGTHETPVLHQVDLSQVPPASLAQTYYEFAEAKLLEGSEQHPWFSDIFYSMGRTYQADADSRGEMGATTLRLQALVYYRVATAIRPQHHLATNQLGYVLLQVDRPREAQVALVNSVRTKSDLPGLQNLAEASRRLGDQRMQQWAIDMIASIRNKQPIAQQQQAPDVLEVDNRTFGTTTPIVPNWNGSTGRTASGPGTTMR